MIFIRGRANQVIGVPHYIKIEPKPKSWLYEYRDGIETIILCPVAYRGQP